MGTYEKALELWRRKSIKTDTELAEALSGYITLERSRTCQRRYEIVRKRRRNFVGFRRGKVKN